MKIKFRAWDTEKQQMCEVLSMAFEEDDIRLRGKECETWTTVKGYIAIPMQYTGLKDINGTDIYEGDILHRDGYWDIQIEWDKGSFMVRDLDKVRRNNLCQNVPIGEYNIKYYEVIGNIYENPELLSE